MKIKLSIYQIVFLAIITIGLASCKKDGPTGPEGPAGPAFTGSATGFVELYDQYGNKLFTNLSNTKIVISGMADTILTDSLGKYTIANLTTGTYNATVSKSGFGSVNRTISYINGNNTFLSDTRLSAIPTFSVSTLTAAAGPTGANYITVSGTISTAIPFAGQVVIFVGKTSATSASVSTFLISSVVNVAAAGTTFTTRISLDELSNAGLTTGQTAYFAAYAMSTVQSSSSYEDTGTGQTVYTAINPSNATSSFLMP